jgi:predicted nucleic acid-binding protein
MDEYLLDTNHVIPLLREQDPRRGVILAKLSTIPAESQFAREEVRNAAKWPEVWTSPVKGQPLGADEFDLIMVSHAMERNMVLVTNDPMRRIIEGISSLGSAPRFDNWISIASGTESSP